MKRTKLTDEVNLNESQLDLQEGIDDEAVDEQLEINEFNITTYGVDYTIDTIVGRMKSGAFYIPPFQRAYVWSQAHASRFIESLLLGLPIPGVFLYKETKTNKHLVIDGQQRLRSLQYFLNGKFGERNFRLKGIKSRWKDLSYEELNAEDKLRLNDTSIHSTIFQQDSPSDNDQSIYYVFERINSGGMRLSPQEIRVCVSHGPFVELIQQINTNEKWRKLYKSPLSKRLKDQELIIRFFAFLFNDTPYIRAPRTMPFLR